VLQVGSRVVAVFRSHLGASDPHDRANAAVRRIKAALAAGADSVATRPAPEGMLFLLGGRPAFVLTSADADTAGGQTLEDAATTAARRLHTVVTEARESRSIVALLVALAQVLSATAGLALAIALLVKGRRRVLTWLDAVTATALPKLRIRFLTLLRPSQLIGAARAVVMILAWAVGLIAGYIYLTFLLTRFPATRGWGEALGHYLVTTVANLGLGALRTVPGLFTVVLIFLAARFGARLLQTVFDAVVRGRLTLPGIHPDTARPTRRIATALLWMFALIVAYPYLPGSDSAAFKGVSVFAGILVSLGSAGLVGQAMSGLVLMYSRAYREGDYILAGAIQGTVQSLNLLSTRLRTVKNEYVTLPNNVIVTGAVTNYSAAARESESLTIYSSVTIGYDVPWRRVHELLIAAAARTDGVLAEPEPYVLQRALNDWYVEYQVNAAIDPQGASELPRRYSALHANIQDAFNKAGVEIMSPTYLALRDGNTPTIPDAAPPKKGWPSFRVNVNPSD
jgi:small-conductance mechanosensitive channel